MSQFAFVRHVCGHLVNAPALWSALSLVVVVVVGRSSCRGTMLAVAAWCCRWCFGCCTRYGPGLVSACMLRLRWHCTQLRHHYSKFVGMRFGFVAGPQLAGLVRLPCGPVLTAALLVLELHSARMGPVISATLIWCWLYLTLASTSGMPWSSGLGGPGAVGVGVLSSGEGAFLSVWPLVA